MDRVQKFPKVRKAIIPAAGLGTRFLPATKAIPKEMIPVVDKPAIQHIVEEALESGIEEILIVTGRNKHVIEDHFDIATEMEAELAKKNKTHLFKKVQDVARMADIYYVRQKEPLGLGHAIGKGRVFAEGEPIAVLLPDEIMDGPTPCIKQLLDLYNEYGCSVLAVREVPDSETEQYGIVDGAWLSEGVYDIRDMVEKPAWGTAPSNLAIVGRYIITPEIFPIIQELTPGKNGEYQLTDALKTLLVKQKMLACPFEGERYDVGNQLGFIKATVQLALKKEGIKEALEEYLNEVLERKD